MNKSYLPTPHELQSFYEEDLRSEALDELQYENSEKQNQNIFFTTFRKFEEVYNKSDFDSIKNNIYYKKYKTSIEEESIKKAKEIKEIENLIAYERFFLKWERKLSKKRSNRATRYRVDRIKELKEELEKIIRTSKEAWEFYYKRQLIWDIENKKEGNLIMTPYVLNAKQKVMDSLDLGIPVYIVGHLGSGKTQLAMEAALDFTLENRIQNELEIKMEKWFSLNLKATEKDIIEKFKEFNEERRSYYKELLRSGQKEEIEKLRPFFISGSHNLTYEDMFVEKTLSLKHSFSKGSFSDYLNMIIDDFYHWIDEHKERLETMTDDEQLQLKIQIWKSFSDLLVASNSAFGTEILKIEKEILLAAKEGRPVIVDELNTIAMQNLIGLNDILQRRAGTTAYITGVGPIMIKPGFGFIGTGNLSTQMVNYEGTNELNPAFKSRFITLEYNYVPQKIIGTLKEQEKPEENQLFRIILAGLAEKNATIYMPNPQKTLDELFRFSQLCRVTQNVFMGKWRENDVGQTSNMEDLELRESVLSIRNILHVLDHWNFGEEKDLSKALWDGFISLITYADDQNYILSQSMLFGFFPASEGWNIKTKGVGEGITTYEEIRTSPYTYIRPQIGVLSYLDIVYLIFGKGPIRANLPKDLQGKEKIDINKYQDFNKKLTHLEHTNDLIDYLKQKEEKI